jgi:hypothetical protein
MADDQEPVRPQDPGSDQHPGSPEHHASQVLMDALAARKEALGGAAQLPPEDRALSERILGEARRRSEQISASRNPAASSQTLAQQERIPWWILVAWILAIIATVIAFKLM